MRYKIKGIINNSSILELFLMIFCFVQFCSPLLDRFPLSLGIVMITIMIIVSPSIDIRPLIVFFILLAIVVFRFYYSHSSEVGYFSPLNHLIKYIFLFEAMVCAQAFEELTIFGKRRILLTIMIGTIITNLISIYYTFQDGLAIRYRGLYGGNYPGIIHFGQIFGVAILVTIMLLGLIFKDKSKSIGLFDYIIYLITLVTSLIMLSRSQLATPILLSILILGGTITFVLQKKPLIKVIVVSVAVFLVFMWNEILQKILEIISFLGSDVLKARVSAVINTLLQTGGVTTSLDNRNAKINISLSTFKEHPLVGAGFSNFNGSTIGCHQDVYDILAVLGIIGILYLVFCFYVKSKDIVISKNNRITRICFGAGLLYFVVLGFLDPNLELSIVLAVFMIAPNITVLVGGEK